MIMISIRRADLPTDAFGAIHTAIGPNQVYEVKANAPKTMKSVSSQLPPG